MNWSPGGPINKNINNDDINSENINDDEEKLS